MAKQFTDDNMAEALAAEGLLVVDFWAEWCGPCKKISPVIDELAEEYAGVADIRKCDVEENPEACEKFGVMSIPALIFIKNWQVVDNHVGTAKKELLKELIEKHK